MNNAFFAKTASDELSDTLFFGGWSYQKTKEVFRGQKSYVYKTADFTLRITGRQIQIDKEKFTSVSQAKRYLQSLLY